MLQCWDKKCVYVCRHAWCPSFGRINVFGVIGLLGGRRKLVKQPTKIKTSTYTHTHTICHKVNYFSIIDIAMDHSLNIDLLIFNQC